MAVMTYRGSMMPPGGGRILPALILAAGLAARGEAEAPAASAVDGRILDSFTVQSWTVEDGLPESTVVGLSQAENGYFWVATRHTLSRFDGQTFIPIRTNPRPSGWTGEFESVHAARDGSVWVTATDGVYRWHRDEWSCVVEKNSDSIPSGRTLRLSESPDGSVWMLFAGGLVRWRPDGGLDMWPPEGSRLPPFEDMAVASDGSLWLSTTAGVHRFRDFICEPADVANGSAPTGRCRVGVAADGRLFAVGEGRLWQRGDTGWTEDRLPSTVTGPEGVLGKRDGSLWIAGGNGLYRRQGDRWSALVSGDIPTLVKPLCLLESYAGGIWVGGEGSLLCLRAKGFRYIPVPGTGFHDTPGVATAIWSDGRDRLLVGHRRHLYRLEKDRLVRLVEPELPPGVVITALLQDPDGTLWIGTGNEYLWKFHDGRLVRIAPESGRDPPGEGITALAALPDRRLLIGTSSGLAEIAGGRFLRDLDLGGRMKSHRVRSLQITDDGMAWIVYETIGLVRWRPGQPPRLPPPDDGIVARQRSVFIEPSGSVWIGTSAGLLCRDQDGETHLFTRDQGLPDGDIVQISKDDENRLWIGSRGGIAAIRLSDLKARQDGHRSGLPVIRIGYGLPPGGCFRGFNGAQGFENGVWFPVLDGVAKSGPDFIPPPGPPPVVHIEGVKSASVPIADWRPQSRIQAPSGIVDLSPGARDLDIQFTAIGSGPPDRFRFRYRIPKVSDGWIDIGVSRSVSLAYLPPGRHVFEVVASAADGIWSQPPASIVLHMRPHPWQAAWFLPTAIVLAGTLAAIVAYAMVQGRYRRRMELANREKALQEERARIAGDLHDNLGAGLTEIAMLGELVFEDLQNRLGPADRRRLGRIPESARELVRSVDEIVWAINPRNDTLDSTASYLAQAAERLQAAGAPLRLDIPQPLPTLAIPGRMRHGLMLACQEALTNAIRHARAERITMALRLEGRRLQVAIADNGCGFDLAAVPGASTGHDGLSGMVSRMMKVDGRCDIDTRPGGGTRVTLTLNLP